MFFWNIRGLGQKGKLQCLSDLVNKYKPDFLGFQEIKRETLSDSFLNALAGSTAYEWHMLPAVGSAGGILVGTKTNLFEVLSVSCKKYCIIITLKNKTDGFCWHLIVVYGTAYAVDKLDFIVELHESMDNLCYLVLFGGDFNLIREAKDKSSGNINTSWTFLFNDWINKWGLMEYKLSNRVYTWSNNQDNPIFATIDRVFSATSWDSHFPSPPCVHFLGWGVTMPQFSWTQG